MQDFDYACFKNIRPPSQEEIVSKWPNSWSKPLVSIVCVTYNHENYIEDALHGFLIQKTTFPFEILVHDDASTDSTPEILERYRRSYGSLIKIVRQSENQYSKGLRVAPIAFSFARGEYIAFCEGDDFWTDPNKIQKQHDLLEQDRSCAVAYHDAITLSESGEFGGLQLGEPYRKDSSNFELMCGRKISTLTAFFRNIEEIRNVPRVLAASPIGDLCFWSTLGGVGKGVFSSDIGAAVYRMHPNGVHSLRPRREQAVNTVITMLMLSKYHYLKGRSRVSNVLLFKSIIRALRLFFLR